MAQASRDQNFVTTLLAVSSVDGVTPVTLYANPTTHRLLVDLAGGGSGTVQTIAIATANGFAGSSDGDPNNPTLTLSTTVTGIVKGNGTAISAASAGDVDSILPTQTGNSGKYLTTDGTNSSWATVSGSGDVVGPASSTDNALAVFNGTTGKLLENSTVSLTATALSPITTDTVTLGTASLQWSDLFMAEGGVINFDNGDLTLTQTGNELALAGGAFLTPDLFISSGAFSAISTFVVPAGTQFTPHLQVVDGSSASASIGFARFSGASATVAPQFGWAKSRGSTVGDYTVVASGDLLGAMTWAGADGTDFAAAAAIQVLVDGTPGNNDMPGRIVFSTTADGASAVTDRIIIDSSGALKPASNDGSALGNTTNQFSDLFLAEGGVINWDNGDVTITQTSNVLAIAGITDVTVAGNVTPAVDGTGNLGAPTVAWDNLYLDTAAVINFDNGNSVITHSSAVLTVSTGDLRVTTAGTNTASVVTVGGTQTLTNKTLTSPTLTTPSAFTTGGTITLAENTTIALDPAGSADGKYTGITVTGTAGYTQAFGDLVYLDPTDSRWEAADANSASGADGDARGILGMVVSAGTDGNACTILLVGIIRADAKFPSFTVNNPIYVSETAGSVTQTQPTTTDVVIRVVGAALTADEMYFNPDFAYITHT